MSSKRRTVKSRRRIVTSKHSSNPVAPPAADSVGWLIYKLAANGGIVFQYVDEAIYDEAVHGALAEAKTWGEFRRLLPPGEWDDVRALLERDDCDDHEVNPALERWHLDDTPFKPESIPGFCDGDWPRWRQQEMDEVLPEDLLRTYGRREASVLNGLFWLIPHENEEPLVAELRRRGYHVEHAEFLRGW